MFKLKSLLPIRVFMLDIIHLPPNRLEYFNIFVNKYVVHDCWLFFLAAKSDSDSDVMFCFQSY